MLIDRTLFVFYEFNASTIAVAKNTSIIIKNETSFSYYMYESFSNQKLLETGSIFNKFKGISNNIKKIDAAFVWSNGKTYIFTGDEYYRLNGTNNVDDKSFPRKISANWVGIPESIDSVFVWKDGATYFFKGML